MPVLPELFKSTFINNENVIQLRQESDVWQTRGCCTLGGLFLFVKKLKTDNAPKKGSQCSKWAQLVRLSQPSWTFISELALCCLTRMWTRIQLAKVSELLSVFCSKLEISLLIVLDSCIYWSTQSWTSSSDISKQLLGEGALAKPVQGGTATKNGKKERKGTKTKSPPEKKVGRHATDCLGLAG